MRQELQEFKLTALRHRARSEGIDECALEEATDADDPKAAVMALLLRSHVESLKQAGMPSRARELHRSELQQLGLKELRLRARAAGVDEQAMEDVLDADEPTAAMAELLMDTSATHVPEGVPPAKDAPNPSV